MNILAYNTPEETAKQLAKKIASEVSQRATYHLALSGGSDTIPLYGALVAADIDWRKVHLYFVYEAVNGPEEGKNAAFAQTYLLDKIPLPEGHFHPIEGAVDPACLAASYAKHVEAIVPHLQGSPRFDMVLLEMHEDGHTAAIFPGQEALFHEEEAFIALKHPQQMQHYVTMSMKALENAKTIIFYSFDDATRFVIGNIVNLMAEAKNYPANYLAALCPWATLYTTEHVMREKTYTIY